MSELKQKQILVKVSHKHERHGPVKVLATHEAEHLSTLVTPADHHPPDSDACVKRLRQLHEKNQLNKTKVQLVIQMINSHYELHITDDTTGETCERMRLSEISHPIYRESNDPSDNYRNLLMFNKDARSASNDTDTQHEMHIFQCIDSPAHVIVDEITNPKSLTSSASTQEYHDKSVSISPKTNSEDMYQNEADYRRHAKIPVAEINGYSQHHIREKVLIDSEILLLNMCFDDIESYVGQISKLQRARLLNAQQEAESNISVPTAEAKKKKRFVFKKKSTANKSATDIPRIASNASMSSEVEIPISDDELVDLFEKVKFAIVLLSRLQGYVTDPNPPLLTHRMFTMLKQPIDFIRDPVTGSPDLAKNVISPAFPEAALRLIQDSLIEPELSMWHELGDGWNLAKDKWETPVPTYIPVFICGFRPKPENYHFTLFDLPENDFNRQNGAEASHLQEEFHQHLVKNKKKFAIVKQAFKAETEQELSLRVNECLEILDDSRNWYHVRNYKGAAGYVPYTVLKVDG